MRRTPFRLLFGAVLLSGAAMAAPAWAQAADNDKDAYINPDRPGIADGSNVVGKGRFEIETGIQAEFRQGGQPSTSIFVPTLLRYGVSEAWELRIEGNTYSHVATDNGGPGRDIEDGFAPVSVGIKYHLLESKGSQPSVGVIARVFPPSGSGSFRNDRTTGDVRLAADWDFAPHFSLNPNIGVAVQEDDSNRTFTAGLFAMTLNYNPSKVFNLFVDTGIQTPEQKNGKTSVILDGGVAYIIGHNLQLDLSAGVGAAGVTPPHPFISGGISARF